MTKQRMPEICSVYNSKDSKNTNEGKINRSRISKPYIEKKHQLGKIQLIYIL